MEPLLIIDVQPAFSSAFTANLVQGILSTIRKAPKSQSVVILSVDEELSGDTADDIQAFWQRHGMTQAMRSRVAFHEKSYGFFRGWTGRVDDEEIVAVAKELRRAGQSDTRMLDEDVLEALSEGAPQRADPLFLPCEIEDIDVLQQPAWRLCGGARDECLKEVELWLASLDIATSRLDDLVY